MTLRVDLETSNAVPIVTEMDITTGDPEAIRGMPPHVLQGDLLGQITAPASPTSDGSLRHGVVELKTLTDGEAQKTGHGMRRRLEQLEVGVQTMGKGRLD